MSEESIGPVRSAEGVRAHASTGSHAMTYPLR